MEKHYLVGLIVGACAVFGISIYNRSFYDAFFAFLTIVLLTLVLSIQ